MYNTSGMRRSRIVLLIAAVMSCLALAPAARAADPPIPQMATTEPATGVTSTTAVLNGRIDTGGAAVIWHFEYGLSQNYDSTTPPQRIDPGSQTVNVTSTLTGIEPLSFYHYRLVVIAGGYSGHSLGADQTFLTAASGFVLLRGSRLKAIGRTVSVPLSCASQNWCTGWLTISTTTPRGTVVCDSNPFWLKPGARPKFKVRINSACKSLITSARQHRIKAKVTLMPHTSQIGIVGKVTLTQ